MYKYSKTTNSFYPLSLLDSYCDLPSDLVEVSEEIFNVFSGQPPVGKQRGADNKGLPAWVDLPEPEPLTQAQIEASKRTDRDAFLLATDKMMLIDYSIKNVALSDAQRAKLIEVRNSFRTWTENEKWFNSSLPNMPIWLMSEAVSNGWRPPRDYYPSELDDLI